MRHKRPVLYLGPGHAADTAEHFAGVARPWRPWETPTVRTDRPNSAHRPSWQHGRPSAIRPWTAHHDDLQCDKVTQAGTEKNGPLAENSQLAGRFRRWWQVLGSNHRRLSRRFYSPLAPPEPPHADQRIRRSRRVCGPPPSAMRPRVPGSGGPVRSTDGHGPAHGRARKRPRMGPAGAVTLTVPARIPALTCHFRMPARCRRCLVTRVFLGVLGAEGLGDALVGGGGLAGDAVGVDLEQDRDAVPGAASTDSFTMCCTPVGHRRVDRRPRVYCSAVAC